MARINISIDDMCPHPQSSVLVLDRCYELLNDFPDIKFSLFIPMAYTRYREKSYPINQYKDFCFTLKNLSSETFEIGWHGYHHGILNKSNNNEFRYLDYKEACILLDKMFLMAKEAGVYDLFSPVLRPSAFWISPQAIQACSDMGIKTLALISSPQHKAEYNGADEQFENVVYYDYVAPNDPIVLKDALQIVYHACEWDQSYLSNEMTTKLRKFLKSKIDEIEFCFINDIGDMQ